MIINTAGEYTLQYTATDACGNSTTVQRDLVVEEPPTYRTVLYTDGTLIINESSRDEAHNVALHGVATNVYIPFDPNGVDDYNKYIFGGYSDTPWNNQLSAILSAEVGSSIHPTSTAFWFAEMPNCKSIDMTKLNTDLVTSMQNMFADDTSLESIDVSNFDTSSVTNMVCMFQMCQLVPNIDVTSFDTSSVSNMTSMFNNCRAITSLDLSSFDTSNVTNMMLMFNYCNSLKTVYASENFVTAQVTTSTNMFLNLTTDFVGGAGTAWNSSNPADKTYARIDNPPSAPGYFTAKS